MRIPPRMRPRTAALLQGLVLLALSVSWQAPEPRKVRPAPLFEGLTVPEPPRQKDPWAAPETSLPKFLTRASATLFEQGLADPRGGDYRSIEIVVGSVWSNAGAVIATHGWVLPETPGETARFAVTWSGLVYPTVSVGEPANLEADVVALEEASRAQEKARNARGMPTGFNGFGTTHEEFPVSLKGLHPIKISLLLRLGRAELAERVWAASTGRPREEARNVKIDLTNYGVSYVTMANDLAWYHFERAVCAHMRGDDAIALADARWLTAFQKAAEAKAEGLGFPRPDTFGNRGEQAVPYIGFLGQLPDLLADHERRAKEPKRSPVPPPGADKKAKIAALIADLDQIFVAQFGQPGGVSLGESSTVQALIKEGDDAVEPLIDDLETDVRLTRAVHFHRDFRRSRIIMGAHEAAYTALCGLLKTNFFGAASTGDNLSARGLQGRIQVANRIRDYWRKNRDVPLVERWYRSLADDIGGSNVWLQAAGNIVRHENVSVVPGSTAFTHTITVQLPPGARPKLMGEALREKKDPSVADLMARRVNEIDPGEPLERNSSDQFKVGSANNMAAMLAEWDPKAALPVLKARVDRCARVVQAGQKAGVRYHDMEAGIARLTDLRLKSGDPEALGDYAAWIRTVTPEHFDFAPTEMFGPLWRHPEHPAVRAAAEALFEDPKSPWNPSIRPRELDTDRGHRLELLGSPLLGLKPYRALVIRALGEKTQVGTIEVDAGGKTVVIQGHTKTVSDGQSTTSSGIFSGDPNDTESPFKPGPSAMPLRVADLACEKLQKLEGIPHFLTHWPVAKRDEALAACIAYLKQYGDRFRENEASRAIRATEPGSPQHERAILAFDPLDHPATADDVAAGRAIFTLEGKGAEVRPCKFPSLPLDARWTKLEIVPEELHDMATTDAQGHTRPYIEGLQTGRVWQAEEVREGGRWRRYFGFAGRHALTRVPDTEVEFPASWHSGWSWFSTDLDAKLVIKQAAAGGPIPVELSFRNHHGVETSAPTELIRKPNGSPPSIREGITFRLVRESDKPEPPNPFTARERGSEKPFPPEELAALAFPRHPRGASPQTLAPAESVSALRLDLRTLFRIDQPGAYRLEIAVDDLKAANGSPAKVATQFFVPSAAAQ